MLLHLAFRNLRRNIRRSLITIGAVAMGMTVLILSNTLRSGQYDDMIHSSVSQLAGHVVIQHPEYETEPETELVVSERTILLNQLRNVLPEATITSRTIINGILSSSSAPSVVSITGIDPTSEAAVSDMDEKIIKGTWVTDDKRSIVIGQNMAETLQVDVGDKLVFTTSVEGEMTSHLYRLTGVFRTGVDEVDAFLGFTHLISIDQVLGQNEIANQVAIHLSNSDDTESTKEIVQGLITKNGRSDQVYAWQEVLPDVLAMIKVDRVFNEMISVTIMLIVAMGILNTILMNVLERSKEFGVLLAVGLQRTSLMTMILYEAALLGIIGGILGAIFGVLASYPLVTNGLDLSQTMGEGMEINGAIASTVIYGRYDLVWISGYVVLSIACSVLSALYPAWKIQQLTPVDAMRK